MTHLVALAWLTAAAAGAADRPPNVVLVFADDLGGVGCLLRFWTTEQHLERLSRTRSPAAEVAS